MALGVVDFPERARMTLPSLLRNSMTFLGLRAGPKPVSGQLACAMALDKHRIEAKPHLLIGEGE